MAKNKKLESYDEPSSLAEEGGSASVLFGFRSSNFFLGLNLEAGGVAPLDECFNPVNENVLELVSEMSIAVGLQYSNLFYAQLRNCEIF